MKKLTKAGLWVCLMGLPMQSVLAGPYYGFNVGGNSTTVEKDITYNDTRTFLSDKYSGLRLQLLFGYNFGSSILNSHAGEEGMGSDEYGDFEEIHADKDRPLDDLFFAVEADINYNTGDASSSISPWYLTSSASVTEQVKYGGDIFLLAKYRPIPSATFFVGPGVTQGYFNIYSSGDTAGNLGVTGDFDATLTGWTLKAGVEVFSTNSLNMVLTYQYTNYNSITWSGIEPLTGDSVSAKYMPVVNSITIGVNMT